MPTRGGGGGGQPNKELQKENQMVPLREEHFPGGGLMVQYCTWSYNMMTRLTTVAAAMRIAGFLNASEKQLSSPRHFIAAATVVTISGRPCAVNQQAHQENVLPPL
jgi:hypothetical protein